MGQIQSLADFLSMVRRRILLIVAVLMIGTAVTIAWTLGQPKIYEAIAVAQIESPTVRDTGSSTPGATTNGTDHRLRILEQKLMARDNLVGLVENYGLYANTGFSTGLKVATLREAVRLTQITDQTATFGASRVPTGMMIAVTHSEPVIAAELANDFLDQLVSLNRERRTAAAQQNLTFFQAEATRVEAEIRALEARIASFKEQNAAYLPTGIAAQRDELGALKTTLLELEQKFIELDAGRSRQRAEVIERQSALLREQEALIQARIDEINRNIAGAPEVDRQFGILTREMEQLQEQHSVITRRATEAEMGQQLTSQDQFERIEVLESALVPENPVSGSRKKKAALGAILSGVLGVGLAFLLEMMNPVIRTPAQLERQLDVKAVIAIPKLTTKSDRRSKRFVLLVALAAVLAVIWTSATAMRNGAMSVIGMIAGRVSKV
ncbi:chain-length determining protein [Alisedimentitalea sp. MJ-SS2]|uniref:GumC family protein n=1 Tax=Aliisedimentitalea sp. MJ-SS2 TaxID=3049795 RepID=UPI0029131327|nr:chain-length determining protein [Alisedimentitalea sp. MJ-SS2]MDU8926227.1 chain-length determining protein [Alisedimentitalea sp. MJ-SS2]